jgi:hypothetical protein
VSCFTVSLETERSSAGGSIVFVTAASSLDDGHESSTLRDYEQGECLAQIREGANSEP